MITFRVIFILMQFFILCDCLAQDNKQNMAETNGDKQIKERLYADVKFLTSTKPARNYVHVDGLNKSADYILSEFKKLKCKTDVQKFIVQSNEYKNVIASFGDPDATRIIVGAHYDVAGNNPGADDNASGIAGLLELARKLSQRNTKLNYRYDFVAYSLEEPPYFATQDMGSAIHANSLKEKNVVVKAMICLEMIGYFSDVPNSQHYPSEELKLHYPNQGNFIIVVGIKGQEDFTEKAKQLMKANSSIDVQSISLPTKNQLAGLSDHRNYWASGYPAIMIDDTSFLRNPNYHTSGDRIETLNFDKMAEVVRGVFGLMTSL